MAHLNGVGLGLLVVGSAAASAIGMGGTVAELVAKEFDKEKSPVLRKMTELSAKIVQVATAAFTLIALVFLSHNLLLIGLGLGFSAMMLLTPGFNALIQNSGDSCVVQGVHYFDQLVNFSAKAINTAALSVVAFSLGGPIAATITGVGLGTLSLVTYFKS